MAFKGNKNNKNKAAQTAKVNNKANGETGLQFVWTVGHSFNSDKHKLSRCAARFGGYLLTSMWADKKSLKETLKDIKFHFGLTFSGGLKIEFGIYFPKTV